MDALALVDTMGGLAPHACSYMVKKIKSVIDKPLEVHFHDDFGLGAANTIMALSAGAEVAHTSITGIGERAGNTPYEDVALSLLTMYNIDTGIKFEKMNELHFEKARELMLSCESVIDAGTPIGELNGPNGKLLDIAHEKGLINGRYE